MNTGGLEASRNFLKALKLVTLANSLGVYKSLAELPYLMTHASIDENEVSICIKYKVVRFSLTNRLI